jgi:hypothetical protein
MKQLILLAIVMIVGFSASVMAQGVTATATTTATIIAPLTITNAVDMVFGTVSAGVNGGTVVLATDGTRTRTGDVQLSVFAAGSPSAASFSVTGEGAYTYAITIPTGDYTITETGAASMIVNAFVSDPSGTGALTAGVQTINVGATLNVGASATQTAGVYTNSTPFDVTVVYN